MKYRKLSPLKKPWFGNVVLASYLFKTKDGCELHTQVPVEVAVKHIELLQEKAQVESIITAYLYRSDSYNYGSGISRYGEYQNISLEEFRELLLAEKSSAPLLS